MIDILSNNYFLHRLKAKKFTVATVWSRYSAINSYFKTSFSTNCNSFANLRIFMLNVTKFYKPNRAKILTYGQIEKVLRELKNEEEDLNFKVIICLMFFGLLRGCEVLAISRDEVEIEEETREVNVTYKKSTKTRVSGFSYMIPPQFAYIFEKYFTEWDGNDDSDNLVKNYAPTTHKKTQNKYRLAFHDEDVKKD